MKRLYYGGRLKKSYGESFYSPPLPLDFFICKEGSLGEK